MPAIFTDLKPTAEFDGIGYRYWWEFTWDAKRPSAAWLMMNPSWADLHRSDMTVDRVLHFSRQHGCGSAIVVNLWPTITSDSGLMWKAIPTLPAQKSERNLAAIRRAGAAAQLRVVAFGLKAGRDYRSHVLRMVEGFGDSLWCLGKSPDDWPYHPMVRGRYRIPDDRRLMPWQFPHL